MLHFIIILYIIIRPFAYSPPPEKRSFPGCSTPNLGKVGLGQGTRSCFNGGGTSGAVDQQAEISLMKRE
jgi:hypothetical protein